ncbi:hypothetical protein N9V90_00505 [Endozoicomonas sp.]|nr:hypothetical protein [Endozoicomonas sp.]
MLFQSAVEFIVSLDAIVLSRNRHVVVNPAQESPFAVAFIAPLFRVISVICFGVDSLRYE